MERTHQPHRDPHGSALVLESAASDGAPPSPSPSPPPLHNGSTSSSNEASPTSAEPEIFRTLHVRVYESQRWFPVIGWATSRFPADPPNLSLWPHRPHQQSRTTPASAALYAAVLEANHLHAPPATAAQPVFPLQLRLPVGYAWDGYWELSSAHPRGADAAGWRYAESFTVPGPDGVPRGAHFKRTQTPTCVVRRRVWHRRVRLTQRGPTDSARLASEGLAAPVGDDAATLELYLTEKQDEMGVAEGLKERQRAALRAGVVWGETEELAAEEELRSFTKDRRQQATASATRRLSVNDSFANPFQPASSTAAVVVAVAPMATPAVAVDAVTASTPAPWGSPGTVSVPADDELAISDDDELVKDIQRREVARVEEEAMLFSERRPTRPDGASVAAAAVLTFQHVASPTDARGPPDDGHGGHALEQQPTISQFITSSADGDRHGTRLAEESSAVNDAGDQVDFNAIFSKFMDSADGAAAKSDSV